MKRIVSIVLSLSIVLSFLSCYSISSFANEGLPASAPSAEAGYETTVVDFDSNEQPTFYAQDETGAGNENFDAATDEGHGNVANFTKISNDWVPYSGAQHSLNPRSFAISNNEGTERKQFQTADKLQVSIDVKLITLTENHFTDVKVAMVFSDSSKTTTIGGTTNGLATYTNYKQIVDIGNIDLTKMDEWQTVSGTVTVPSHKQSETPFIILYSSTDYMRNGLTIYLDNLIVKEPIVTEKETVIDFESEAQRSFYSAVDSANRYYGNIENAAAVPALNTGDDHGYSVNFTKVNSTNRVYGTVAPRAIALSDTAGTQRLEFEKDAILDVSVDVYVKEITNLTEFYVAIVFDDYRIGAVGGNVRVGTSSVYDGGINALIAEGKLVDIGKVDATATNQWQTVSTVLTVPAHDYVESPILVLYSKDAKSSNSGNIYLDNIVVDECDINSEHIAAVDFDSYYQPNFYSENVKNANGEPNNIANANMLIENFDAEHGNVVNFDKISSAIKNNWASFQPRAIALGNPAGVSRVNFDEGDCLDITFDIKVDKSALDKFYVGLVFSELRIGYIGKVDSTFKTNAGLYYHYKNGTLYDLALVDATESDWQTYNMKFQVPAHTADQYPMIVIYSKESEARHLEQEIYLDNIIVDEIVIDDSITGPIDFDSHFQPNFYSANVKNANGEPNNIANANMFVNNYDAEHGNVVNFDKISSAIKNNWATFQPRAIALGNAVGLDRINFNTGEYVDFKFDIKVDKSDLEKFYVGLVFSEIRVGYIGKVDTTFKTPAGLYYHYTNGTLTDIAEIDATKTDWQTITAKVPVIQHTADQYPMLVIYSKESNSRHLEQEIYMDNIFATVDLNVPKINLEANGGSCASVYYCIEGNRPMLPVPTKEGCYFEGWYLDEELTKPYNITSMPAEDFTIYAKWSLLSDITPKKLETSFEADEYAKAPYTNILPHEGITYADKNFVSDNVNSNYSMWVTEDEKAHDGTGYLFFDNRLEILNAQSDTTNAMAILNPDGSNYKIVAGTRYHMEFAFKNDGLNHATRDEVINFVVSERTPAAGLNMKNCSIVYKHPYSRTNVVGGYTNTGVWGVVEVDFEATVTGNLYITMHANTKQHTSKVDSLKITPSLNGEMSQVRYLSEDGSQVYATKLGLVGRELVEYGFATKKGYAFNGWKTAEGKLFIETKFPASDIDVYASFTDEPVIDVNTSIDASQPITASFEGDEAVKIFYGRNKNISNTTASGMYVRINDPQNAHTGNNYMSYKSVGSWLDPGENRRFKVYADGTPNNYLWLDANSQYYVSYWIKVDLQNGTKTEFHTMSIAPDSMKSTRLDAFVTYELEGIADYMGIWQKVEQKITTGAETSVLGFEIDGGNFTACIDDVTIQKLGIVTVKFESNGGSAVTDIEQTAMDYAVQPVPPTKEGYTFAGWYTDSALTNPFDFANTLVNEDMTLYAKWVAEVSEGENTDTENETDSETEGETDTNNETKEEYMTVYSTEYVDEIVENEIADAYLDNPIEISAGLEPQDVGKVNTEEKDDSFPWWIIIVICAVVVAGAATVTVILIRKKRNKK